MVLDLSNGVDYIVIERLQNLERIVTNFIQLEVKRTETLEIGKRFLDIKLVWAYTDASMIFFLVGINNRSVGRAMSCSPYHAEGLGNTE